MSDNHSVTSEASSPSTTSPQSIQPAGNNLTVFVYLSAAGLIGSFFLPWLKGWFGIEVSGFKLAQIPELEIQGKMLFLIPGMALITILAGAAGQKMQGILARITGFLPLALLIYVFIRAETTEIVKVFDFGAWATLGLGIALFTLGCVRR